jgi:hypothetical protein
MTKGERNHLKRRVVQMEVVLNLCANRETMHENHLRGTLTRSQAPG